MALYSTPSSSKQKPESKKSGTKSYGQAWSDYKASGKTKYKDEASFTTAAKSWNKKTYGTTEPTAKAGKMGMSKSTLASEKASIDKDLKSATHGKGSGYTSEAGKGLRYADEKKYQGSEPHRTTAIEGRATTMGSASHEGKLQTLRAVNLAKNSTETKANERMAQASASAQDPQHKLIASKGTRLDKRISRLQDRKTRREDRESARQERKNLLTDNPVDDRAVNKANKAANKTRSSAVKTKNKRAKKEKKQDLAQMKGDRKLYKQTGIRMS